MLYWLCISFCCFGKDYCLYGGKTIDKVKNLDHSWATSALIKALLSVHFCMFTERHNSICFNWKVSYGCHFIKGLSNDRRLYITLGQWPNNTVLFKLQSGVNKNQAALVDLAKFNGIYHQSVKIFQTKLLRSLKFRIVAVYEFFKNKSVKVVGSPSTSFRFVSNIRSKTWWEIVKSLRKVTHYPKECTVSYTKNKSLIWTSRVLGKILQQLLCFVLEPLVELTLDFNSFGFRKYRSAKMAVGFLRSCLKSFGRKKRHVKLFSAKLRNNSWSILHESKWVLDVDIRGFFSKVHCKYLLANLPLPSVGLFFVQHLLSSGVFCQLSLANLYNSVFQESILFSVLVGFTLNNLKTVLNRSVYSYTQSKNKSVTMVQLRSVHYFYLYTLSYADNFVVLCCSKYILKAWVLSKIVFFLKERGLGLSLEKTKFLGLRNKSKLEFLGYTFRAVTKWWTKNKAIHLNYLTLYPGRFNFAYTIHVLKQIFYKSLNLSAYGLIAKVNFVLRGWWYYFNIGNCMYHRNIYRNLLYKMVWRWSHRKHRGWTKKRLAKAYFWMDKLNCNHGVSSKKYLSPYNISICEKRRFFHGVFRSKWIYLFFINSKNTIRSALVYNVPHVFKYYLDKHFVMKWLFKTNQPSLNSSLKRVM